MLGRGRFSTVVQEGEQAVKIIDIDDQCAPHNYKAELAALKMLGGHPNITEMLRTETTKGFEAQCRIYMHLYPLTLDHVLFDASKASYPPGSGWRNCITPDRIGSIARHLAEALAFVHSQGIIHRDIKPENILFESTNSEPMLADFGISWVPGFGEDPKVSDVGTAEYRAPELLQGKVYTNAIDVWAYGCVVAKLCSAKSEALFTPYRSDLALWDQQQRNLKESVDGLKHFSEQITHILRLDPISRPSALELTALQW